MGRIMLSGSTTEDFHQVSPNAMQNVLLHRLLFAPPPKLLSFKIIVEEVDISMKYSLCILFC